MLVGRNTILSDNPFLNNRIGSAKHKLNTVAILDSKLEVLANMDDLKIFETHSKLNLIFITTLDSDTSEYEKLGFQFIKVSADANSGINLHEALVNLKKIYKINSVFVEGGKKVIESCLRQKLFNEIYIFSSLKVIFKISSLRMNWFLWMKHLGIYLRRFKFKIFEDNFLLHFFISA